MDKETRRTRSKIMACVKSSGNKSKEMKFIYIMRSHSITGWHRHYPAYGKPDFVFLAKCVAVFIENGDCLELELLITLSKCENCIWS